MAFKKFGEADVHPNENGRTHVVAFHSYVCDSEADVANLPNKEQTAIGSIAVMMDTNVVYWLTTNGWARGGGGDE